MSEQNKIQQMQQTIDQLRANAKGHKRTIDKMSAKVSKITQQRDDAAAQLSVKEQEAAFYKAQFEANCTDGSEFKDEPRQTRWPTLLQAVIGTLLFGFFFALGAIGAYGWVFSIGKIMGSYL